MSSKYSYAAFKIGWPQNTATLSKDVFNVIQQYIDLVEDVKSSDLFTRMQGVENVALQNANYQLR
ncbi:19702_t:CDS:2 [Gigaspora margarita]|uniref:19702_t:CDS:1 n=1 Tax=Gigaspora margarita TaxID=4874 RepID=A0ABN7V6C4_GIGMA|nr:19702_t:CDS:2 [Gigaspora margarita]